MGEAPGSQAPAFAAPKGHGYFATLGVTFEADETEIAKRYKKLSLKLHPDKNKAEDAVDVFQRVTTSYHTLVDPDKKKSYMDLFRLRCYMSQRAPLADELLMPHYAFVVEKSKHAKGVKSVRLLVINFFERTLSNFKKDTLQKEFELADLQSITSDEHDEQLALVLRFKNNSPYYLRAQTRQQYLTMVHVFGRVTAAAEMSDEAIGVVQDDANAPGCSRYKSKVLKRTSSMGDNQPRFMVLGSTHLLIFRSNDLQQLVNMFPVDVLKCTGSSRGIPYFYLSSTNWRAVFRVLDETIAKEWVESLHEVQRLFVLGESSAEPHSSLIFDDVTLVNAQARPRKGPFSRTVADYLEPSSMLRLPPPPLAAPEAELTEGWLEYKDEAGRPYYYHPESRQTQWELPAHIPSQQPSAAPRSAASPSEPAVGGVGSPCGSAMCDPMMRTWSLFENVPTPNAEEDRKAAELLAEGEREKKSSVSGVGEAKEAVLASMLALERRMHKAKRTLEFDRGVDHFASLWEHMKISFEELERNVASYKSAASASEQLQREFMQQQGSYLNGLQSHMLDSGKDETGLASNLFKKCAYVAHTLSRNKHVAL